ncbi:hypothetical protein [Rhizobium sp. C4]|uniref:hypothetical protein n=1 Tax=Rhizobium sp. C4 TaxID=1349800 RepID=UPI001E2DE5FD|nr:hypothetical protein [Rhizobium sp. C4]MCD2173975.1 hypothetical protein [Rhizobium sp. C4]
MRGIIGSGTWQTYTWKNDLHLQSSRVAVSFAEYMDEEYSGAHVPFHMLERAFVLCGFIMRRMMETRVVTDKLREREIEVRCLAKAADEPFFKPWVSNTGPREFRQYAMEAPELVKMTIREFGNEIIHASQLAIAYDFEQFDDGILIASDWHYKKRLLHVTPAEFQAIVDLVLNDEITSMRDAYDGDPADGKITCIRE